MTANEILDRIKIIDHPHSPDYDSRIIEGRFTLHRYHTITRVQEQQCNSLIQLHSNIRREIHRDIMRELYDDQRQGLYKALLDVRAVNPMDSKAWFDAQTKLLSVATFQQPKNN